MSAPSLDNVIYWALWVVVWLAPGLVTALIASEKGRSPWRWLALGAIASWIALVAIVVLPDESGRQPTPEAPDGTPGATPGETPGETPEATPVAAGEPAAWRDDESPTSSDA